MVVKEGLLVPAYLVKNIPEMATIEGLISTPILFSTLIAIPSTAILWLFCRMDMPRLTAEIFI